MNKHHRTSHRRNSRVLDRQGTAAIETAIISPILLVILFGAIDIAQYVNTAQVVSNAAREGARKMAKDDTTKTEDVERTIYEYLQGAMPNISIEQIEAATEITIRHADEQPIPNGDLETVPSGSKLYVNVQFDFRSVRWMRGIDFWNGDYNTTKSYCRRD